MRKCVLGYRKTDSFLGRQSVCRLTALGAASHSPSFRATLFSKDQACPTSYADITITYCIIIFYMYFIYLTPDKTDIRQFGNRLGTNGNKCLPVYSEGPS